MIEYEVVEQIATLSEAYNGYTKELNLIAWNKAQPKYDLRTWRTTETGKTMCKGITLSEDEMKALVEAMKGRKYGNGKQGN